MSMYGKEMNTGRINTSNNKIRSNVASILEQVLFQQSHAGDYSGFSASTESVELKVGRDKSGCEFSAEQECLAFSTNQFEGKEGNPYSAAVPAPAIQ
jgi:hypothetical protein